jgi:hypothetical protein
MTLQDALDVITKVGFSGLLVIIIYGNYKSIWVWGSELERERKEKEVWKDLAMRNLGVAQKSLTIAEGQGQR